MKAKQLPDNYNSQNTYSVDEAAALLPQLSTSKFVGSVDIDVVLAISEKQKKEAVKGSVVFTNTLGGEKKVIVFGDEKEAKAALAAGADAAGLEDLITKVESGKVEFDIVIATPSVMAKIAKLGKVLGPKGLMPNPANETVTNDIERVVAVYKAGKQNFKMTEQGVIRARVAKTDMTSEQIAANIKDFLRAVNAAAKKLAGQPFKKITLSPTMGKPVRLDIQNVSAVL
jgi:large subunit ribosomal protein L1